MSDFTEDLTFDLRGLDQLIKAMKVRAPRIRVGIIGSSARPPSARGGKAMTNAEVGAAHEFGDPSRGLPQRSFLRIPLSENLNKELERSGLLDQDTLSQVIKSGSMVPWMNQVAIAAEAVVEDAFEHEGPGWVAWSKGYSNATGTILTDTGSLRRSISSEVVA